MNLYSLKERTFIFYRKLPEFSLYKALFFLIILSSLTVNCFSQSSGDYRTKQNGNWNTASTWETYNGAAWVNASSFPTSSNGVITIRNMDTVTVTAGVTVDQVVIESGGKLIHNSGTFKIADGTGDDIVVYGAIDLNAALTLNSSAVLVLYGRIDKYSGGFNINSGAQVHIEGGGWFRKLGGGEDVAAGSWIIKSGGTYEHDDNGASLPIADWQSNSTCVISGTTTGTPGNLDQSFYNFTWNCPDQTVQKNLAGNLGTVLGNLTIISTGSGSILLAPSANQTLNVSGDYIQQGGIFALTETGSWIMNVSGNFSMTGGIFKMTDNTTSNASGTPTLNVNGNMSITNATLDMSEYKASNSLLGISTLNLYGNLSIGNNGFITTNIVNTGKGIINFTGSSVQSFSNIGTISTIIDFNISNGTTFNMGQNVLTGTGDFNLNDNASLIIGSPDGISATNNTGNIQVSGTRTFSNNASYYYDGSSAQVTGDGLPSTIKNLSIDNNEGVIATNSYDVTGVLTLSNGTLFTNGNTITLGNNASSTGTLTTINGNIDGAFSRWISTSSTSYSYPLTDNSNNKSVRLNFNTAPSSGGTYTIQYMNDDPGTNGLPKSEDGVQVTSAVGDGYWNIGLDNGLSGGAYTLSLDGGGVLDISDLSSLRVIARTDDSSPWGFSGTHVPGIMDDTIPVAKRSDLSGSAQFAMAGGEIPLPVDLVYFKAEKVNAVAKLSWETASEQNSDHFTVDRSKDGASFNTIGTIESVGNSSSSNNYSFTDENPMQGMNYYRLKQTDIDGKSKIYQTRALDFGNDSARTFVIEKIWPIPFADHLTFTFYSPAAQSINVQLCDMNGKPVTAVQKLNCNAGDNSLQVNSLKNLSKGMFDLIISADKKILSRKMILKN